MRSMPTGQPIGTFHAVATRDGEACPRDGQKFSAINLKSTDEPDVVRGVCVEAGLEF